MYITDGVFSMDGDVAKLPEIVEIAEEFGLLTYVDDAHGSGVMGKGAGTVKHFGLQDKIDFQIGTLSKAIGVVGGYVAGTKELIDWLKAQSRPFLFSTSLAPGDTKAITEAVKKLMDSTELHDKLWNNAPLVSMFVQTVVQNVLQKLKMLICVYTELFIMLSKKLNQR